MKKTLLLCLILLAALFALSVTALADADPNDYLTFTDDGSTGGSFTITLKKSSYSNPVSLQYRTWDGSAWGDWTNYTVGDAISGVTKIQFNSVGNNNTFCRSSGDYYFSFASENKVTVSGNIMTLLGASYRGNSISSSFCFYELFKECSAITSANELLLPATTLAEGCYCCMFVRCTSLTAAPALPATTLANSCYGYMFSYCTSLTAAPTLSATTLAPHCCEYMFESCTSLVDAAPSLSATTLARNCYEYMFYGCTSLVTVPALSATTLAGDCCDNMFCECTSLVTAPALPATKLAEGCYNHMFYGCTSLTAAPALPATTLAEECYSEMFAGCTSLVTAPTLPATELAENCYTLMFGGCTSLVTAPALPATTLADCCYNCMFNECTSLVTAPALPATTLAYYCYGFMFNGCTSLTTVPGGLSATNLGYECYEGMFSGCTSLPVYKVTDPDIANFTLADGDTWRCTNMFKGTEHDENVADSPAAGMYMIGVYQGSVEYTIDAGSWDDLKTMKVSITLSNNKTYTDDQTLNAHFSALDPSLFVGEFRFYVNVLNVPGSAVFKSATLVA